MGHLAGDIERCRGSMVYELSMHCWRLKETLSDSRYSRQSNNDSLDRQAFAMGATQTISPHTKNHLMASHSSRPTHRRMIDRRSEIVYELGLLMCPTRSRSLLRLFVFIN